MNTFEREQVHVCNYWALINKCISGGAAQLGFCVGELAE